MYGMAAAEFRFRAEGDIEQYEELEEEWLIAFFEKYVHTINEDHTKVYDITRYGISTGRILCHRRFSPFGLSFKIQKTVVNAKSRKLSANWTLHRDEVISEISREAEAIVAQDLVAQLMAEAKAAGIPQVGEEKPSPYLITDAASLNPASLRHHDALLDQNPLKTATAGRLRAFGVKV